MDGTPNLRNTRYTYDSRGNRSTDDNLAVLTNDGRTYTYDSRRNVINIRGQYSAIAGFWRFYNVASAFDAKNRRVYKSYLDETTLKVQTWFYYYDALDRLTEVRHTPDTSAPSTYSIFQLVWLGNQLVAYWQTDYPSVTTSKRYVGRDESGRPIDMISGDATRVWAVNPTAWGDEFIVIGSVYQPILFAGQYQDRETYTRQNGGFVRHRPPLVLNGFRTYDPWIGSYLQVDPLVDSSWSSHVYADSNPVGKHDPNGKRAKYFSEWCVGVSWEELNLAQVVACIEGRGDPGGGVAMVVVTNHPGATLHANIPGILPTHCALTLLSSAATDYTSR